MMHLLHRLYGVDPLYSIVNAVYILGDGCQNSLCALMTYQLVFDETCYTCHI